MTESEITELFDRGEFQRIADLVDTSALDPLNERGLVVFNPTSEPLSGIAVFPVDMPWREGRELPAVGISHLLSRRSVRCSVTPAAFLQPRDGGSYGRIRFKLSFEVEDVPAQGWDTYRAHYLAAPSTAEIELSGFSEVLRVFETTSHPGSIPARNEKRAT